MPHGVLPVRVHSLAQGTGRGDAIPVPQADTQALGVVHRDVALPGSKARGSPTSRTDQVCRIEVTRSSGRLNSPLSFIDGSDKKPDPDTEEQEVDDDLDGDRDPCQVGSRSDVPKPHG
jgi:hypothetical protein